MTIGSYYGQLFRRKPSGIKTPRGAKSLPVKQKNASRRGMPKDRSCRDSANEVRMTELRKKITIFRDISDQPACDASAAITELPHSVEVYVHRSGRTDGAYVDGCSIALISPNETSKFASLCKSFYKESFQLFPMDNTYMPELMKRLSLAHGNKVDGRSTEAFPDIVLHKQLSEIKEASTEKVMASCKALKSIGESWMTSYDRLDKSRYDFPSLKENVNQDELVEAVLVTLDCLMKKPRDKFDMMDEDDQKREDYRPRNSSFGKFLSDLEGYASGSTCPSPITPSSKANIGSKSPLLWTLRVQTVGKLNPIDVKNLYLHLSKQGAHGTNNGLDKIENLFEEPPIGTKLESNPQKTIAATDEEVVALNLSLDEKSSGKGIDNTSDDVETPTTASETLEADTT
ncbi:hypothetical protein D8674_027946 [Pyrus ussuriensis x Pyrus communis]|uniref:Uncharacterized protein n=1 Tax=Pyrus ussuriensis x Pyrus communis TaxID=2448454 RepID=A0A5N5IG13_9ROSA|nr:hypothetical protein D8674_027946 [Pyrus ussuriensis x Pyrus communis]